MLYYNFHTEVMKDHTWLFKDKEEDSTKEMMFLVTKPSTVILHSEKPMITWRENIIIED